MAELIADPFRAARLVLHLRQIGITDDAVLKAMETIDRGAFIDNPELLWLAFEDCVLPIPCGQMIPRPGVTAQLLQALDIKTLREARILLIGMGSGFTAALAAQLGADVFAVERYQRLCDEARARIVKLRLENVAVRQGDGLLGWPERGPYDRILLTGAVSEVPSALLEQLTPDGLLVAPMPHERGQHLVRMDRQRKMEGFGLSAALPFLLEGQAAIL